VTSPTLRAASTALAAATAWGAGAALEATDLVQVASGFQSPLAARHAGDGSGRLFVVERAGRIRIFDGTQVLGTPFLDITTAVDATGNEQGLLGLAFHPDYASNGLFYVNYTYDPAGAGLDRTRVSRFNVSGADPDLADPSSEVVLLEVAQDFDNHNGGNILFGPDGYLYVGMGDGGSGGDPNERAQDRMMLLGKMLRIDVDSTTVPAGAEVCGLVANYGIPADNPFAGADAACDEIWSLGLRNPWRWSFDRQTGDLFIGDVGQDAVEEIDLQPASSAGGENWGWRCYEGSAAFATAGCQPAGSYDFPVLEYGQMLGRCSVTGGYRYRGTGASEIRGTYVYGDYCTGEIWFATESAGTWSSSVWMDTALNISSFGEDEAGELYVVNLGGSLWRIEGLPAIFVDGFETGDTSKWSAVEPAGPTLR